jgi:hypothetical protein
MEYRYGVAAIRKETNTLGLMGVAHTQEEAKDIKDRVERAGLWRDVEVLDGLEGIAEYTEKHGKKAR